MASMMITGGTLAFLTDLEMADNTFTVGKVKIDLEEPNYPGNDSDEVKAIVPNQTVAKDPQIENTGDNEAIVYLKLEVPREEFTELGADNVPKEKKLQELFTLKDMSDQWELIRTDESHTEDGKDKTTYIYAYKKPLGKGETTDKLFQKVQMKNALENGLAGKVEDIKVSARAIQSTDMPGVDLTRMNDGTIDKDDLDKAYTVWFNQNHDQKERDADDGSRTLDGKLGRIRYVLDGGEIDGEKATYDIADYGYIPPSPAKEGYTFEGWEPEKIPVGSEGNITFTAKWKIPDNFATLTSCTNINKVMKTLAGDKSTSYSSVDTAITSIQHSEVKPTASVMNNSNSVISDTNSKYPVYMWYENGVIKWWSEAERVNISKVGNNLCANLQNLTDISGLADWDASELTNLYNMFSGCTNLIDISPLANWNISDVTNMYSAFKNCSSLTDLTPLKNWDMSKNKSFQYTFNGCSNLTDISILANWDISSTVSLYGIFSDCSHLVDLTPLTSWNTSNVTNFSYAFNNCSSIEDISPLTNWDVRNAKTLQSLFSLCSNLRSIAPLANWDVHNVTNMESVFNTCGKIEDVLAINDWDIDNATNFTRMFRGCASHPEFTKKEGTWNSDGTFTPTI